MAQARSGPRTPKLASRYGTDTSKSLQVLSAVAFCCVYPRPLGGQIVGLICDKVCQVRLAIWNGSEIIQGKPIQSLIPLLRRWRVNTATEI